jgi:hypothetical protein
VFNIHIFCVLSYVKPFDWSQHVEPTHVMVGIDHGSDEVEDDDELEEVEEEDEDDEIAVEGAGAVDLLKFQLYSS